VGSNEASGDNGAGQEGQGEPKKDSKFTVKQSLELGGIAGVFVVWAEIVDCHNVYGLIAYGLALILLYLPTAYFIHERLKKRFTWVPITIWFLASILTALFVLKKSTELKPDLEPIAVAKADLIKGTKFTRDQVEHALPFGYAIIYLDDDGHKEVHEYYNKKLNWKVDWDTVKIKPDIQAGVVTFEVSGINASGTGVDAMKLSDMLLIWKSTFKEGVGGGYVFGGGDEPTITSIVLSDNQRRPCFAIGYRIATDAELGRPK